MMKRLDTREADFQTQLKQLTDWQYSNDKDVVAAVDGIVEAIATRGDDALLEYTRRFDGVEVSSVADLELSASQLAEALQRIDTAQRSALEIAQKRIADYHERQRGESWDYSDGTGTLLGQRLTPLERVGVYVPGGKASYPSSVLMNVTPARVAGVDEVIMVTPTPQGDTNDMVLAAASLAGVDRLFCIGGAQAVAALAYGTETVPPVDKIVGPGNVYVAAAKRRVFGQVGIDMVAGPSEILIICDGKTPADWIAMDLFSQAEHDEQAQSILVSHNAAFLDAVAAEVERLLPTMPRSAIIRQSLENRGAMVLCRDLKEAAEVSNTVAPEHLELSVEDPQALAAQIRHAGAIFMGRFSAEAFGDYCAGPNHVLPTSGTARFSSPLGVYDFQKRSSVIMFSREGVRSLAPVAAELARGESLDAHALSAEYRNRD
ncbi:MAG: histidinol dehydrogenase [Pseudomonadota bacterium]